MPAPSHRSPSLAPLAPPPPTSHRTDDATDAATAAGDRRAHVPANVLVALYLAASAVPLGLAVAHERADPVRMAAHLALLAVVLMVLGLGRWRPATFGGFAALLPLLLVPPLYTELPHVAAGLGGAMHDATVIRWEQMLFGDSPARTLSARAPWPALGEVLHGGYLSYYFLIYVPPLCLLAAGRRRALGETAFTVMLAFVCCYVAFIAFPVQGPWFEWPRPAALPAGHARALVERILHAGSARGTAFPSSHVAVSVAQTLVTLRHQPRLGLAAALCTIALALGAVYGGLHYGVDVIAGVGLGVVIGVGGPAWFRRVGRGSAQRD